MLRSKLSKCDSMVPVTLSVAVPFSVLSATQSINVLLSLSALDKAFHTSLWTLAMYLFYRHYISLL